MFFVLQLFGDFENNESYPVAPSAAPVAPTPVIASSGQGCKISDYTQLASYLSSLGNGPAAAAAMAAAAAAAVSSAGMMVINSNFHSYYSEVLITVCLLVKTIQCTSAKRLVL